MVLWNGIHVFGLWTLFLSFSDLIFGVGLGFGHFFGLLEKTEVGMRGVEHFDIRHSTTPN